MLCLLLVHIWGRYPRAIFSIPFHSFVFFLLVKIVDMEGNFVFLVGHWLQQWTMVRRMGSGSVAMTCAFR